MLTHQEDRELLALSREIMQDKGLDEATAVQEARQRLDELRRYSNEWDRIAMRAHRAQRLHTLWYGKDDCHGNH